jgi:hypothetical protein
VTTRRTIFDATNFRRDCRNPPIVAVGEQGWLTPLHQSAGDSTHTVFRCRCGAKVIRRTSHVTRAVRNGGVPKCPDCDARVKSEVRVGVKSRVRVG